MRRQKLFKCFSLFEWKKNKLEYYLIYFYCKNSRTEATWGGRPKKSYEMLFPPQNTLKMGEDLQKHKRTC